MGEEEKREKPSTDLASFNAEDSRIKNSESMQAKGTSSTAPADTAKDKKEADADRPVEKDGTGKSAST